MVQYPHMDSVNQTKADIAVPLNSGVFYLFYLLYVWPVNKEALFAINSVEQTFFCCHVTFCFIFCYNFVFISSLS